MELKIFSKKILTRERETLPLSEGRDMPNMQTFNYVKLHETDRAERTDESNLCEFVDFLRI